MKIDELQMDATYTPLKNICFLMAMGEEAKPIVETLGLVESETKLHAELPMRCFQKKIGSLNISLVIAGIDNRHLVDNIGSEAATLMAYEAIIKLKPDLLISAGTAGGFAKNGASIGTVYVSEEHFVYHDRHVPLPGFDHSAVGKYPAAKVSRLAKNLHLKQGVISTGSSLEKNAKDIIVIDQHNAVAKEMEAAGIAWVAMLFKVPMMALKSITNLLDEDNQSESEFVNNLAYSSQCLHDKTLKLVDYLQGKSLQDLA
jgi:nucleoside phosphorylase